VVWWFAARGSGHIGGEHSGASECTPTHVLLLSGPVAVPASNRPSHRRIIHCVHVRCATELSLVFFTFCIQRRKGKLASMNVSLQNSIRTLPTRFQTERPQAWHSTRKCVRYWYCPNHHHHHQRRPSVPESSTTVGRSWVRRATKV